MVLSSPAFRQISFFGTAWRSARQEGNIRIYKKNNVISGVAPTFTTGAERPIKGIQINMFETM